MQASNDHLCLPDSRGGEDSPIALPSKDFRLRGTGCVYVVFRYRTDCMAVVNRLYSFSVVAPVDF